MRDDLGAAILPQIHVDFGGVRHVTGLSILLDLSLSVSSTNCFTSACIAFICSRNALGSSRVGHLVSSSFLWHGDDRSLMPLAIHRRACLVELP